MNPKKYFTKEQRLAAIREQRRARDERERKQLTVIPRQTIGKAKAAAQPELCEKLKREIEKIRWSA